MFTTVKLIAFRRKIGATADDKAELKSWSVTETASRGSSSNTVPDYDTAEQNRLVKTSREVRVSLSNSGTNLFHPDLDLKTLMTNIRHFYDKAGNWPFPIGQNAALRKVWKIHTYANFLDWIQEPTGRAGVLSGPGNTRPTVTQDLMFVHEKRWEKLNDRAYKNTNEERARCCRYMDKFLEIDQLIQNRRMIRKMLRRVAFQIPDQPMEARRVTNYKQFLANVLIIIEAAYSEE